MSPKPNLRVAGPPPDLVAGGPVEFDELFARYGRYVAQLTARLLGSGDAEIDDVVQDVFWLASRRLPKIVDMIQARGWLATVTTRLVGRRLRRRRFRRLFHGSARAEEVPAPGATAEQRALLVRLYKVLETLPTDQRLAWSLRYLEGEPLDAIAAVCGCSLATAKRRVSAAKKVIDDVFLGDGNAKG
jgi:RNA polymerase sigma-70 factor (ECF subfamily)